jgi:hypothetical protein
MTIVKRQMGATNMTGSDDYLQSGVIENAIHKRIWTINDILNADDISESIVDELIKDMDDGIKWRIVKSTDLGKEQMSIYLRKELNNMVSFVLTKFLRTATVDFGGEKNEKIEEIQGNDDRQVETDTGSLGESEKMMTLKERIRLDTKLMDEKEKKNAGLI